VVDDIFDLQDEITREVVTGLRVQLTDGESAATWNRGTRNIEAWRLIVQGHGEMFQFHAEGMLRARDVATRARNLDPDYATAWALEGMTHWYEVRLSLADDRDRSLSLAVACAAKATALDAENPSVIVQSAITSALQGRYDEALDVARRGLASNPGSADVRAVLGMCQDFNGNSVEAVGLFDEAKQLNPLHPIWYFSASARALDACGRQDDALRNVRDGLSRQHNNFPCLLQLASLLGRRGETAEAARATADALRHSPGFTLDRVDQWLMTRNHAFVAEFKDGLRKSGLREG
jgi:adenylate cyclase